ncbi:MAG: tetratricopeptide repeat protein [Burkholderiales bacterium]|nr:tetratricopeptide repeat protein [Burkholderiales bacterium]
MGQRIRFSATLVAAAALSCALALGAAAQDAGRDYYTAGASTEGAQMLRNLDQNHYRRAVGALERRRYEGALADLEFMLKYVPNHPRALAGISQVAIGVQRPGLAEQRFKAALERYPQHDETYVIYGVFLHKLGRTDAAIAQYRKALEINASSGFAHYNLGLAYVDTKDYAQANAHAQKAYQLGVSFPGLKRQLQAVGAWKSTEPSVDAAKDSAGDQRDR